MTPTTIEREAPRWGVYVPQFRADISTMTTLVARADEAGIDNFWLMDHLVTPGAMDSDVFEGWTLLTAPAAATIGGGGRQLTMPLVAKHVDWWSCVASARERLGELAPLRGAARVSAQYAVGLVDASAAPASASGRQSVAASVARRMPAPGWGVPLIGTPDELVEQLRAERAKGVEMFVLRFHDHRDPTLYRRFMTEVAAHVR